MTSTPSGVVQIRVTPASIGLDTGANGSFLLFDYFTRRNPSALPQGPTTGFDGPGASTGVGGAFSTSYVFAGAIELGQFTLPAVLGARVTSERSYTQDIDGVIGAKVLRWFTVGFDYAHERVYLTPNAEGRAKLKL